jgi:hypothetical protein
MTRDPQFDNVLIVDLRGNAPSFYPTVLSALLLIREVDPRRYYMRSFNATSSDCQ